MITVVTEEELGRGLAGAATNASYGVDASLFIAGDAWSLGSSSQMVLGRHCWERARERVCVSVF